MQCRQIKDKCHALQRMAFILLEIKASFFMKPLCLLRGYNRSNDR